MCEAFPRIASCTFHKYGSGGKIASYQAICVLALNIVIDKIYLVLWYWYFIVALLGTIRIICRIFQMFSGNIRYWLMKIKMHRYILLILGFKKNIYLKKLPVSLVKIIGVQRTLSSRRVLRHLTCLLLMLKNLKY